MADGTITDPRIARVVQEAMVAQRRGDLSAASRLFHQALAIDANQPIVLNALGMIALRGGDESASDWFGRACKADPSALPLWMNLASAHRARRDGERERAALERALALDRRDIMANLRMAELLDATGRSKEAFEHWRGLATMLPGIADRPPELDRILETARGHVARHTGALAAAIDARLAPLRADATMRDRHRFDACVDRMLGRRRVYVNECHGLHFPFLPAEEFFDRDHFAWMPDLEAKTPLIRAELEALLAASDSGFAPYVTLDPGSPENSWTALDGSDHWSALYLWRYGERDAGNCARCPETAAAMEEIPRAELPGQAPSVFFSILKPGTRLPPHTGVSNVRSIVHLPLIVPTDCGFRVGGETREWTVGEAFAFDDTIEHEAWNEGASIRAVLIFDVWNPHIVIKEREMLRDLFATMRSEGSDLASAAD